MTVVALLVAAWVALVLSLRHATEPWAEAVRLEMEHMLGGIDG